MLPKEINLFGTTFRVSYNAGIREDADDATCGVTCVRDRTIEILPGLSPAVELETFYHELTHVILDHLGLNYFLTPKGEEVFAQAFGIALTYLVTANNLPALPTKETPNE